MEQQQSIRPMLAKYFSANKSQCSQEIKDSYNNRKFGPVNNKEMKKITNSKPNHFSQYAFICPHGAFCDGGPVMAHSYYIIQHLLNSTSSHSQLKTLLLIGNSHSGHKPSIVLSNEDWQTPFGIFKNDIEITKTLANYFKISNYPHRSEHSIENQLPYLYQICPKAMIVPISVSWSATHKEIAKAARLIHEVLQERRKGQFLVVGTTDFTHAGKWYKEQPPKNMKLHAYVRQRDTPVIQAILDDKPPTQKPQQGDLHVTTQTYLKAQKKHKISMCGPMSAALVIELSRNYLGLKSSVLLKYAVSGEILKRPDVTGFASIMFYN